MNTQFSKDLVQKAKQAKSKEELLTLAKESDIAITEEEANEYFKLLCPKIELMDEELDNVSGGGCGCGDPHYNEQGYLLVNHNYHCQYWKCPVCGSPSSEYCPHKAAVIYIRCDTCASTYETRDTVLIDLICKEERNRRH